MTRITDEDVRKIVQLRGLGYSEEEIAQHLKASREAVNYHLRKLKKGAEKADNLEAFFWGVLLGTVAVGFLEWLFREKER